MDEITHQEGALELLCSTRSLCQGGNEFVVRAAFSDMHSVRRQQRHELVACGGAGAANRAIKIYCKNQLFEVCRQDDTILCGSRLYLLISVNAWTSAARRRMQ